MTQALEKIKVIDLTRLAPGPYCTMFLADLGAQVLRVEEFGALTGRRAEQAKGATVSTGGASAMPDDIGFVDPHSPFNALNRNKQSIGLNLKNDSAKEVFYKLVKEADVVVEEFRPGVSKRLGIDYDTLKEINPRIIYCAITGFGQESPYRDVVGHDVNYVSMAGALSIMGKKGEPPMIPANILADYAGSIQAAYGILAAIIAREQTGKGQFIDMALTDSVVSMIGHMLSWSFAKGRVPGLGDHVTCGAYPFYNVYEAKDGKFVSIGCMEPWFYAGLCRALGREDFIPYQFTEDQDKRKEIHDTFRDIFLTKTRDEWFDTLPKNEVCVGKVYSFDELAGDPHMKAREMIVEMPDNIKQVGVSVKLSDTPGQIRTLGPKLGEHTEEVLLGLGYSEDQIKELEEAGAVYLSAE